MTQITIANKHKLINFHQLISAVKAKGRQSRAVTKFGKLLTKKLAELQEDEKELIARFFEVTEDGNAKKDDEGNLVLLDGAILEDYDAEWDDLHAESVVIDLTEYQTYLTHLITCLLDWDQELSGVDAVIYNELLDLLEGIENKNAE
ncbi:conserved hypothetical protein [Lactococcus piscium]|nr:conserved hypothetical protein [Lactococcus piscium]